MHIVSINKILKSTAVPWLLILTSVSVLLLFTYWVKFTVYDPLLLEQQGHRSYASQDYQQAYDSFYQAVKLTEEKQASFLILSARYRLVAAAAHQLKKYKQARTMVLKSLVYNPNNVDAKSILRHMDSNKQ